MDRHPRRRPVSYHHVVAVLRAEITGARYAPGERLPTHVQLQRRFRTTPVTVQRALRVLAHDGFIRTRGGAGLFVAQRPPHLTDYALLFPTSPDSGGGELWSRLYAALANQAAALNETGRKRVIPFYGMDNGVNAVDYPRLLARVEAQRLAGIIFTTPPFRLINTPVLDLPGIPRVGLMCGSTPPFSHLLAVTLGGGFWEKALDYLATRGRRRIAAMTLHPPDAVRQEIEPLLAARGMTLTGLMPFGRMEGAQVYVQALMQPRDEPRADAMILSDDNLVEPAIAGLVASGVRVGQDMDVVAHANFPWAGPTALPIKRLGYDARAMLRMCLQRVDAQRRGEVVRAPCTISPEFEEELQPIGWDM